MIKILIQISLFLIENASIIAKFQAIQARSPKMVRLDYCLFFQQLRGGEGEVHINVASTANIYTFYIWIQHFQKVRSDLKSVKSYGFGFGVGFTLGHRLDRIMDLFFCLDLGFDSFFSQLRIRESESDDLYCTAN